MWSPYHEAHNQRLSPQGDVRWRKAEISFLSHQGTASHQETSSTAYYVEDLKKGHTRLSHHQICTGVDVAGSLFVKTVFKVHICLFTCGITRAIHILSSLASSLITQALIRCLRRFVALREFQNLSYLITWRHSRQLLPKWIWGHVFSFGKENSVED